MQHHLDLLPGGSGSWRCNSKLVHQLRHTCCLQLQVAISACTRPHIRRGRHGHRQRNRRYPLASLTGAWQAAMQTTDAGPTFVVITVLNRPEQIQSTDPIWQAATYIPCAGYSCVPGTAVAMLCVRVYSCSSTSMRARTTSY